MTEEFNTEELLQTAAFLVEQAAKNQNSVKAAADELVREQKALEAMKYALPEIVKAIVVENVKRSTDEQRAEMIPLIKGIKTVTAELEQMKHSLGRRAFLTHFGIMAVFAAAFIGFMYWFTPSLNEIKERRAELDGLNAVIEHKQDINRIQTSKCKSQMCVKVVENQCNYGTKGNRYCIVDLE